MAALGVSKELEDSVETLANLELWDHQGLEDPRDLLVLTEDREPQAEMESSELMDLEALLDFQVLLEFQECQVSKDTRVFRVNLERRENKEDLEIGVQTDLQELQETLDLWVLVV